MLGHLQDRALQFTERAEQADVIVINTCGFIEDAKQESIDVILEMARHRTEGHAKKLIVTGCLVQRYGQELHEEIPEIDVLLGNGAYEGVAQHAQSFAEEGAHQRTLAVTEPRFIHQATSPRLNSFMPHCAYVKVSEGCDQKCSFCIIPQLRGRQRSRPVEDIVQEVQALADRGVVEVNLVAQDLTGYGTDLPPKTRLADLLVALGQVEPLRWIRLHYAYPRPFPKSLLDALSTEPKVVPYIDMPLQHIADPLLKTMGRGRPRRFIEKLLGQLRANIPNLTLRSSFIVGFPGETDDHFRELCTFIESQDFEHVGVFKFSREENTASHDLPDQVPEAIKDARYHELMALLRDRSQQKMKSYLGQKLEVLVDGPLEPGGPLSGRHRGQAPEVDGNTLIWESDARVGDLVEVEITETLDYDLGGTYLRTIAPAPHRPSHARLNAPIVSTPSTPRGSLRVLQNP